MPVHRVMMPSTSSSSYKLSNMKRMDGGLIKGCGGSILLGGVGGASSYPSVASYEQTTGRQVKGFGLEKISSKISGLSITPRKKKQTIKFDF